MTPLCRATRGDCLLPAVPTDKFTSLSAALRHAANKPNLEVPNNIDIHSASALASRMAVAVYTAHQRECRILLTLVTFHCCCFPLLDALPSVHFPNYKPAFRVAFTGSSFLLSTFVHHGIEKEDKFHTYTLYHALSFPALPFFFSRPQVVCQMRGG